MDNGRHTHAGVEYMIECWVEPDGSVSKFSVVYPPVMGPGYEPDFRRDGWPDKGAAISAARQCAEGVIDRWLAKKAR